MAKPNPVVHFEMPAKDLKRVKKFYEEAFNWNMNQLGEDMGSYLLAGTVKTDDKTMMPTEPGAINGGFFPVKEEGDKPHIVISVDNLAEHMEMVEKAGGKVVGEPMDIQGIGKFVMFVDTEKNLVGMLQPVPMQAS